jgi:hypothetical protein
VVEIMGAEFVKESKVHTAGAISIRFPRILRIRDDKNWDDANTLEDIIQMAAQSGYLTGYHFFFFFLFFITKPFYFYFNFKL